MPIYLLSLIESEEDRISLSLLYERYKKYLYAIALDISRDVETAARAEDISFDSFTRNELVSAMLSIKDEYREILILRYVDEMEFDDISILRIVSLYYFLLVLLLYRYNKLYQ